jgi:membrane glycosyltransferase
LTPEERNPPPILAAARAVHAELAVALRPAADALTRLSDDPGLLAFHRASLPPAAAPVPGAVNVDLALGLARLDTLATLEEASRHLSANEKAALLADRRALERLAKLPRRSVAAAEPARRREA